MSTILNPDPYAEERQARARFHAENRTADRRRQSREAGTLHPGQPFRVPGEGNPTWQTVKTVASGPYPSLLTVTTTTGRTLTLRSDDTVWVPGPAYEDCAAQGCLRPADDGTRCVKHAELWESA